MPNQTEIPFIDHKVENSVILQRAVDGYVNATAMCKVAGKAYADYSRLKTTKAFLGALTVDMGIPMSELVQQAKLEAVAPRNRALGFIPTSRST